MQHSATNTQKEYLKFAAIIVLIFSIAGGIWYLEWLPFMEALMGVFLVIFASFKLFNLKEFAYGFQSYDILAKRSLKYSFSYPFIQLVLGVLYLSGLSSFPLNITAFVVAVVASIGVLKTIIKKQEVHCVCLGNVIKLPLSRISFVEDFGMASMALAMIIL